MDVQINDRQPEEALAFGREHLGTAVKTDAEQSLLQVSQIRTLVQPQNSSTVPDTYGLL